MIKLTKVTKLLKKVVIMSIGLIVTDLQMQRKCAEISFIFVFG